MSRKSKNKDHNKSVKYKHPKFKLVVVEWVDACASMDDENVEPAIGKTVGWLLKKGKKGEKTFLRVSSESFEDGTFRDITAILDENVVNITELVAK